MSMKKYVLRASLTVLGTAMLSIAAHADDRPSLTVAVNQLARTLDPGANTGNVDVRIYYSIFDTLIRRDFAHPTPEGGAKLVPGLAEKWTWTTPTTFEVKLRQGVTCHDGSPFNADDVMATFSPERLWGADAYYPDGKVYFSSLTSVDKVDDHTVRFTTAEHDAVLEHRLSSYMSFVICNEAWNRFRKDGVDHKKWMEEAEAALRWNPVGTGPYKFADYQKNDRIRLVAFDAYYEGKPAAKEVTFKSVPEVAARIAGLVAGDFDIAVEIPPDQWESLKSYSDLTLKTVPLENSHVVAFNTNDPILSDKKLRHALSLAIDRKALIDALWKGQTFTPNGYQLPSFGPLYDKDRKGYAYDPERARKLLKESSYKGQEISYRIIPNYYLYNVEAAQIIQEMWRDLGVNMRIDFVESFKDVRAKGVQIFPWSNTYRIPDPTGSLLVLWGPESDAQNSHKLYTANPEFNELSKALYTESDPAKRRTIYARMQDLFEDDMPMTMLYNPVTGYAMKKTVHWEPYAQYYMDFRPSNLSVGKK
ncbi:ABC transporter substrate-binding protein [Microvirga sp. 17 mud 1-3]|uniref:ABC transporter substrate-binding protein n=1 Tax=Microvirga sp. 17 mud 1-3 TaxID=2082949 RepID=UPI000D6C6267|nr:ABC transporter substrate-binding protein [Microvirga sp. 17 mud 1-3]AWM85454.1 oligopeptide ABC transporter substrate-binding protein [Microvirga sp. 17 mud 1-3]